MLKHEIICGHTEFQFYMPVIPVFTDRHHLVFNPLNLFLHCRHTRFQSYMPIPIFINQY